MMFAWDGPRRAGMAEHMPRSHTRISVVPWHHLFAGYIEVKGIKRLLCPTGRKLARV